MHLRFSSSVSFIWYQAHVPGLVLRKSVKSAKWRNWFPWLESYSGVAKSPKLFADSDPNQISGVVEVCPRRFHTASVDIGQGSGAAGILSTSKNFINLLLVL